MRVVEHLACSSWALDGASTRMPGTLVSSARSYMPWWLGAVGPGDAGPVEGGTRPGALCRATSYTTWSHARLRNVE